MAERPAAFDGPNVLWVAVCLLLWVALLGIFAGPGRGALGEARASLDRAISREQRWERAFGGAAQIDEQERRAWREAWARLQDLGPTQLDEPSLTAWVAQRFRAPSVRGLQVSRVDADEPESASPELRVPAPSGEGTVALRRIAVRVRFSAGYADLIPLLERIGGETSPMRVRSLELRRQPPGVAADLSLSLWTRPEASS